MIEIDERCLKLRTHRQQGTFKFFAVGKETNKQKKNYVNDSATSESLRILLLATFTDVTSIINT